ncbi:MAG: type II toxin-antitoxin system HicB family antitoxin [Nitriliruptorales bacterium]
MTAEPNATLRLGRRTRELGSGEGEVLDLMPDVLAQVLGSTLRCRSQPGPLSLIDDHAPSCLRRSVGSAVKAHRTYTAAMRLTAAITREGDWFVAQCLEVDVASQGATFEEARENLVEALALYFEDGDIEIGEPPIITPIDVAV